MQQYAHTMFCKAGKAVVHRMSTKYEEVNTSMQSITRGLTQCAHHGKIQIASIDEVNETPRGAHCHIHARAQLPDLLANVHSSIVAADS